MFFMLLGLAVCVIGAGKMLLLAGIDAYKQVYLRMLEATRELHAAEKETHEPK